MDYALAKELKDAGFPTPKHTDCDYENGGCCRCDDDNAETCIPTLSELIKACGDGFENLTFSNYWYCNYFDGLKCHSELPDQNDYIEFDTDGSTPEEAVARLYLALKSK